MRAVDTNVLLCLVTGDDPSQTEKAEAFVAAGAWASLHVLTETAWVLATVYERKPKVIAATIEALLDHQDLTIQGADVVAAALVNYRKRPALGFSDCLMLEIARKAGHAIGYV